MEKMKLETDSKERVAFELMEKIISKEGGQKDRNYYLTLYRECLWAVQMPKNPEETE